jgi:hypothetical protein
MRKKQGATRKPTKTRAPGKTTRLQALEERMDKVEKRSGIGQHIKTAITAGAVFSALYAGKGVRECATIVSESLKMPWPR